MIFSSVFGKFARFSRIAAGVIVSDLLQIVAPAQKMPTVLGVQMDATLDPGASPADRDAYILTNTAALHANFGSITGVGNGDIVMYRSGAFVVVFDASEAAVTDRVVTIDVSTDTTYQFSGIWDALYQPIISNFYGQMATPGPNDDSTIGAMIGSKWQDVSVSPNEWYICSDASVGTAVWIQLSLTVDELGSMALQSAGSGPTEYRDNAAQDTAIGSAITAQGLGTVSTRDVGAGGADIPDNDAVDSKISALIREVVPVNASGTVTPVSGKDYVVTTADFPVSASFQLPSYNGTTVKVNDKIRLTNLSTSLMFQYVTSASHMLKAGNGSTVSGLDLVAGNIRHACFTLFDLSGTKYWLVTERENF